MLQHGAGVCQEKNSHDHQKCLNAPSRELFKPAAGNGSSLVTPGITVKKQSFQEFRDGVAEELLRQGELEWWDKWTNCQTRVIPLKCLDCDGEFYVPFHCDLRICPECNNRYARLFKARYLKTIKQMMKRKKGRDRLMLLTLTTKNTGQLPDKCEIKAHNKAIRKFITKPMGLKNGRKIKFKGGVSVNEVSGTYLHSHIIVYGPYIPQEILSRRWEALTGNKVVDIRAVKQRSDQVCKYLTKYLRKPSRFENSETGYSMAVQFLKNFSGIRRVHSFECFYNLKPHREKFVCPYCGSDRIILHLDLFSEGLTVNKCRGSPRIPSYQELITAQRIQLSKTRCYADKAYS